MEFHIGREGDGQPEKQGIAKTHSTVCFGASYLHPATTAMLSRSPRDTRIINLLSAQHFNEIGFVRLTLLRV